MNETGEIIYVNKKSVKMLSYSYEELTKMSYTYLSSDDKRTFLIDSFQKLLKEKKVFIESDLIKKTNSIIPVDINAVALPNGTYLASCRNIF